MRWKLDFRVVATDASTFYIQTSIDSEWYTLSMMSDDGTNYHFDGYRIFHTLYSLLKWYNRVPIKYIATDLMWMPSKALQDIKIVSTKNELIKKYPEALI